MCSLTDSSNLNVAILVSTQSTQHLEELGRVLEHFSETMQLVLGIEETQEGSQCI
jgi:hypothetical protein